ncbi:MAG: 30S ribosomal protein S18 [Fimbriimonadia bacterium]|nr:30S ribosomal protein S18 [Fimbriimonadia bacterium]
MARMEMEFDKDMEAGGDSGARVRKFRRKRKVCEFCVNKTPIDYKDVPRLRRFVSDRGKILARRQTGTCAKCQRALSTAIKRSRELALLPYVAS